MRKLWPVLAPLLLTLPFTIVPSAMAADPRAGTGKSPAERACERACHEEHLGWVDLCIAYHDPREMLASARGQCIAEGAERLKACLEGCR